MKLINTILFIHHQVWKLKQTIWNLMYQLFLLGSRNTLTLHMWQGGHLNPCEMQDCCHCTFLNPFIITNNILAKKKDFIVTIFFQMTFVVLYSKCRFFHTPDLKDLSFLNQCSKKRAIYLFWKVLMIVIMIRYSNGKILALYVPYPSHWMCYNSS